MPTYEYQCKKCRHKFEAWQAITEAPLKSCPVCQGTVVRLIGTGAGFIFKGPGFYATDYRSKEYRQRQKQESETSCPGKSSNETCKNCPANKDAG